MSTVNKKTTNSIGESEEISKSAFDHAGASVVVSTAVKDVISALNAGAATIVKSELKARHVTYEYVSKLCDAAIKIGQDDDFAVAVQAVTDRLIGTFDNKSATGQALRAPNPFLNLVRIADGEWVTEFNKRTGGKTVSWKPNRSGEKYAGVCRFATRNGFSGNDMLSHFMSGTPFKIPSPEAGKFKEVKATINAVIAEDRVQSEAGERDILQSSDWQDIQKIPAVVTVPLTKQVLESLTLSEGGLVLIAGRVEGGNLYLFGDAGFGDGNPVHRQFKKQKEQMLVKATKALREPNEPATLPEEYDLDADEADAESAADVKAAA